MVAPALGNLRGWKSQRVSEVVENPFEYDEQFLDLSIIPFPPPIPVLDTIHAAPPAVSTGT